MKKLLGILVLGLLWCNVGIAGDDIYLKCSHPSNGKKSLIINEGQNKIVFDGYRVKTPIKWGNIISFMSPDPYVYDEKFSHHNEVKLDRVTGELTAPDHPTKRLFVPFFQCSKVKKLF